MSIDYIASLLGPYAPKFMTAWVIMTVVCNIIPVTKLAKWPRIQAVVEFFQFLSSNLKGAGTSVVKMAKGGTKPPPAPPAQGGYVRLGVACIVVAFAVPVIVVGCAALQGSAKKAVASLEQCKDAALKQAIAEALPAVAALIAAGPASWEAQLEALGTKLGMDAVACAVGSVWGDLTAEAAPSDKPKLVNPAPMLRADGWLKKQGVKH